jgi:hypothetical protein
MMDAAPKHLNGTDRGTETRRHSTETLTMGVPRND